MTGADANVECAARLIALAIGPCALLYAFIKTLRISTKYQQGGDFLPFSDPKTIRLATPITMELTL